MHVADELQVTLLRCDISPQIPVMIYQEHILSDQYMIPWWIILIAILAGILILALLVYILWKVSSAMKCQQNMSCLSMRYCLQLQNQQEWGKCVGFKLFNIQAIQAHWKANTVYKADK